MYRNAEGKLYTDVTRETPFNATIGEDMVQAEALNSNTVIYGGSTFVKLTASTYDVEDEDGKKIVMDDQNVLYLVNEGVPESTNYSVIDPEQPEPSDTDSDSDTDTDSDSDSDSDSDTDTDSYTDTDTDNDA